MMKRTFVLAIMLLCSFAWIHAQKNWTRDSLMNYANTFNEEMTAANKVKDYKVMVQIINRFLEVYYRCPEKVQQQTKFVLPNNYYNLACYNSMLRKKKEALEAMEKAVACGYNNYSHSLVDTDLDYIRKEKRFLVALEKLKEVGDFKYILQKSMAYNSSVPTDMLPPFTYMNPNDSNLVRVRQYFNLDSIAGSGNEISKIKNLLAFVHDNIRHDGSSNNPKEKNAIAIYEICKEKNRGVNCRMLAQVLNEFYLAMGFKSRYVTCLPKSYVDDCHVINAVYSVTLNKWLWMDPTQNAYVADEKGNLLGISEVRARLKKGLYVTVNEDANWNHKNKCTNEYYLGNYMMKNLYYLECSASSSYNNETRMEGKLWPKFITLCPEGVMPMDGINTCNEEWFWQSPYETLH